MIHSSVRHVVWFSCGAASAITAKIVLGEHPDAHLVYCDTGGEHEDNVRFRRDVERWLNKDVVVLRSDKYEDHFDVYRKTRYINGTAGARCTAELKKVLRFRYQQPDDIQYFGYTVEEKGRASRFVESFPEVNARFPLMERGIKKKDCVGLLLNVGIEIPKMYKLGFNNNNCIGCCKGGKGYWNKVRKVFPAHFKEMAEIERDVGASCINGTFLDELDPKAGRHEDFIIECDFVCQTMET